MGGEEPRSSPWKPCLDPEFLGRGVLSHLTPDAGSGRSFLPSFLHRSLGFQLPPDVSLLLVFPNFPRLPPLFLPSSLLRDIPRPGRPLFPPRSCRGSFGGRRWRVSTQLPARVSENPGSGRKRLGSFARASLAASHPSMVSHEAVPSPTPGWPATLQWSVRPGDHSHQLGELISSLLQPLVWHRPT